MFWAFLTYPNKRFNDAHNYIKMVTMLECHGNSEFLHEVSKTL